MLQSFKKLIKKSSGFILVTGPTGSGKTTTLYATLTSLNSPEKNIITLEDPVEYNVDGITQGYIHPDAGFTFEKGLRALLRQDPDILMVGEIRDKQTANIAIEAALTGHLVLSTLHTADAPSSIMRLIDMGIEPFLISASLTGILAQRLVRTICNVCRYAYDPTPEELIVLTQLGHKNQQLYAGKGCNSCEQTGFKGRTGIFELLELSQPLRALVVKQPSMDALYAQAYKDKMSKMQSDGMQKVLSGIISLPELMRVTA
jgi:type II secretory ATPase GspE/PulE/Tfp pilus assembly ATPase PilB-like protein